MATRPDTTGAPTRANVIAFPLSQVASLRQQLSRCHSVRMHDRWTADLLRHRDRLTPDEHRDLVLRAAVVRYHLAIAEGC